MDKKKLASILLVIVMAYHEISQLIEGGHTSSTFSLFDFTDNIFCHSSCDDKKND